MNPGTTGQSKAIDSGGCHRLAAAWCSSDETMLYVLHKKTKYLVYSFKKEIFQQCRCLHLHNATTKSSVCVRQLCMCFREGPAEDPVEPEDAGGRVAPVAAGLAAVERLQRAAQQEDASTSQGQPSPPKRPFRTPSVPSLCALATRATVLLMTGERGR